LDARKFSTVAHAGTAADPWPGSAIAAALEALPASGGTVYIADGIWKINSPELFTTQADLWQSSPNMQTNTFNLVGQSQNAKLEFTGNGQLWFNTTGDPAVHGTVNISNLTIDASGLPNTSNAPEAIRVSNDYNGVFTNNNVIAHANISIPAVDYEGGINNQFTNNTINATAGGGSPLQVQELGGTPNTGYMVSNNTFHNASLLMIGINATASYNNFDSTAGGAYLNILAVGEYNGVYNSYTIDDNTLDGLVGGTGAFISGVENDPGGQSNMNGFNITNNILKSVDSEIHVQTNQPDPDINTNTAIGTKSNVTITGNTLDTEFGGGSTIDARGGTYGSVGPITIQNNTMTNNEGAVNQILTDAHTTNATILNQGANVYEVIATGAALEISTADSQSVSFAGSTGRLKLDAPSTFTGTIYNFTGDGTLSGSDQIDLTNINFNSVKDSYASGVLTVTDGTNTDTLNFNGQYTLANFKFASDGSGGTIVYDPPVFPSSSGGGGGGTDAVDTAGADVGTLKGMELPAIAFDPQTTLGYLPNRQSLGGTPPFTDVTNDRNMAVMGSYVASSFVTPGGNYGGTILAGEALESHHPPLTVPQHA